MNELKAVNGKVRRNGTVAYVEQEPFIMTGTVMDNILVGAPLHKIKFDEVVEA